MSIWKSIKAKFLEIYKPQEENKNQEWEIVTVPGFDIILPDVISRIIIILFATKMEGEWGVIFVFISNIILLLFTFYFASRRSRAIHSYLKMRLLSYKVNGQEKDAIIFNPNSLKVRTESMTSNGFLTIFLVFIPIISISGMLAELLYFTEKTDDQFIFYSCLFVIYLLISVLLIWLFEKKFISRKVISVHRNRKKFTKDELKEWQDFLSGKKHKERVILLSEVNDFLIIDIQKKLEIYRQRLDNLSFEAIFLGALTFATFVQLTSVENLEHIFQNYEMADGTIIHADNIKSAFYSLKVNVGKILSFEELMNKFDAVHGIILIAIGCLLSSVFYVIVLMKRFSILTAIERAQLKVERAQTWNVREELNQEKKSIERYTDLIQMELASALEASENIDANLKLTSIIRMLGLYMFFLILLTASYLIHQELFIIISIVTIYGIVASVIMFGFRKRMYRLFLMKTSYKASYQFKIVTK